MTTCEALVVRDGAEWKEKRAGPGASISLLLLAPHMLGVGLPSEQEISALIQKNHAKSLLKIHIPWALSPDILLQSDLALGPKISILTSSSGTHMTENTLLKIFISFNLNLEALCSFIFLFL